MWPSLLTKLLPLLTGPVTKFVTGIDVNAILKKVVEFARLGYHFVATHWRLSLIVLLFGLLLGLGYGWDREHNQLLKEQAAHQLDIANFKRAQADADAKAQTQKEVLQKESKASADVADAKYYGLLALYRANLVRYQASQDIANAGNHNQLSSAQGGNGPGPGTDVSSGSLMISGDDAQICAVNTARLQAVHDWALNPPKEGN